MSTTPDPLLGFGGSGGEAQEGAQEMEGQDGSTKIQEAPNQGTSSEGHTAQDQEAFLDGQKMEARNGCLEAQPSLAKEGAEQEETTAGPRRSRRPPMRKKWYGEPENPEEAAAPAPVSTQPSTSSAVVGCLMSLCEAGKKNGPSSSAAPPSIDKTFFIFIPKAFANTKLLDKLKHLFFNLQRYHVRRLMESTERSEAWVKEVVAYTNSIRVRFRYAHTFLACYALILSPWGLDEETKKRILKLKEKEDKEEKNEDEEYKGKKERKEKNKTVTPRGKKLHLTPPVVPIQGISADLQSKIWAFPATHHLQDMRNVEKDDEWLGKAARMVLLIFSEFSESVENFGEFGLKFLSKMINFNEDLSKKIIESARLLTTHFQTIKEVSVETLVAAKLLLEIEKNVPSSSSAPPSRPEPPHSAGSLGESTGPSSSTDASGSASPLHPSGNQTRQPPSSTDNDAPQDQATSSTQTDPNTEWLRLLTAFRANRDSLPWVQQLLEYPNPFPHEVVLNFEEWETLGKLKDRKKLNVEREEEEAGVVVDEEVQASGVQLGILVEDIDEQGPVDLELMVPAQEDTEGDGDAAQEPARGSNNQREMVDDIDNQGPVDLQVMVPAQEDTEGDGDDVQEPARGSNNQREMVEDIDNQGPVDLQVMMPAQEDTEGDGDDVQEPARGSNNQREMVEDIDNQGPVDLQVMMPAQEDTEGDGDDVQEPARGSNNQREMVEDIDNQGPVDLQVMMPAQEDTEGDGDAAQEPARGSNSQREMVDAGDGVVGIPARFAIGLNDHVPARSRENEMDEDEGSQEENLDEQAPEANQQVAGGKDPNEKAAVQTIFEEIVRDAIQFDRRGAQRTPADDNQPIIAAQGLPIAAPDRPIEHEGDPQDDFDDQVDEPVNRPVGNGAIQEIEEEPEHLQPMEGAARPQVENDAAYYLEDAMDYQMEDVSGDPVESDDTTVLNLDTGSVVSVKRMASEPSGIVSRRPVVFEYDDFQQPTRSASDNDRQKCSAAEIVEDTVDRDANVDEPVLMGDASASSVPGNEFEKDLQAEETPESSRINRLDVQSMPKKIFFTSSDGSSSFLDIEKLDPQSQIQFLALMSRNPNAINPLPSQLETGVAEHAASSQNGIQKAVDMVTKNVEAMDFGATSSSQNAVLEDISIPEDQTLAVTKQQDALGVSTEPEPMDIEESDKNLTQHLDVVIEGEEHTPVKIDHWPTDEKLSQSESVINSSSPLPTRNLENIHSPGPVGAEESSLETPMEIDDPLANDQAVQNEMTVEASETVQETASEFVQNGLDDSVDTNSTPCDVQSSQAYTFATNLVESHKSGQSSSSENVQNDSSTSIDVESMQSDAVSASTSSETSANRDQQEQHEQMDANEKQVEMEIDVSTNDQMGHNELLAESLNENQEKDHSQELLDSNNTEKPIDHSEGDHSMDDEEAKPAVSRNAHTSQPFHETGSKSPNPSASSSSRNLEKIRYASPVEVEKGTDKISVSIDTPMRIDVSTNGISLPETASPPPKSSEEEPTDDNKDLEPDSQARNTDEDKMDTPSSDSLLNKDSEEAMEVDDQETQTEGPLCTLETTTEQQLEITLNPELQQSIVIFPETDSMPVAQDEEKLSRPVSENLSSEAVHDSPSHPKSAEPPLVESIDGNDEIGVIAKQAEEPSFTSEVIRQPIEQKSKPVLHQEVQQADGTCPENNSENNSANVEKGELSPETLGDVSQNSAEINTSIADSMIPMPDNNLSTDEDLQDQSTVNEQNHHVDKEEEVRKSSPSGPIFPEKPDEESRPPSSCPETLANDDNKTSTMPSSSSSPEHSSGIDLDHQDTLDGEEQEALLNTTEEADRIGMDKLSSEMSTGDDEPIGQDQGLEEDNGQDEPEKTASLDPKSPENRLVEPIDENEDENPENQSMDTDGDNMNTSNSKSSSDKESEDEMHTEDQDTTANLVEKYLCTSKTSEQPTEKTSRPDVHHEVQKEDVICPETNLATADVDEDELSPEGPVGENLPSELHPMSAELPLAEPTIGNEDREPNDHPMGTYEDKMDTSSLESSSDKNADEFMETDDRTPEVVLEEQAERPLTTLETTGQPIEGIPKPELHQKVQQSGVTCTETNSMPDAEDEEQISHAVQDNTAQVSPEIDTPIPETTVPITDNSLPTDENPENQPQANDHDYQMENEDKVQEATPPKSIASEKPDEDDEDQANIEEHLGTHRQGAVVEDQQSGSTAASETSDGPLEDAVKKMMEDGTNDRSSDAEMVEKLDKDATDRPSSKMSAERDEPMDHAQEEPENLENAIQSPSSSSSQSLSTSNNCQSPKAVHDVSSSSEMSSIDSTVTDQGNLEMLSPGEVSSSSSAPDEPMEGDQDHQEISDDEQQRELSHANAEPLQAMEAASPMLLNQETPRCSSPKLGGLPIIEAMPIEPAQPTKPAETEELMELHQESHRAAVDEDHQEEAESSATPSPVAVQEDFPLNLTAPRVAEHRYVTLRKLRFESSTFGIRRQELVEAEEEQNGRTSRQSSLGDAEDQMVVEEEPMARAMVVHQRPHESNEVAAPTALEHQSGSTRLAQSHVQMAQHPAPIVEYYCNEGLGMIRMTALRRQVLPDEPSTSTQSTSTAYPSWNGPSTSSHAQEDMFTGLNTVEHEDQDVVQRVDANHVGNTQEARIYNELSTNAFREFLQGSPWLPPQRNNPQEGDGVETQPLSPIESPQLVQQPLSPGAYEREGEQPVEQQEAEHHPDHQPSAQPSSPNYLLIPISDPEQAGRLALSLQYMASQLPQNKKEEFRSLAKQLLERSRQPAVEDVAVQENALPCSSNQQQCQLESVEPTQLAIAQDHAASEVEAQRSAQEQEARAQADARRLDARRQRKRSGESKGAKKGNAEPKKSRKNQQAPVFAPTTLAPFAALGRPPYPMQQLPFPPVPPHYQIHAQAQAAQAARDAQARAQEETQKREQAEAYAKAQAQAHRLAQHLAGHQPLPHAPAQLLPPHQIQAPVHAPVHRWNYAPAPTPHHLLTHAVPQPHIWVPPPSQAPVEGDDAQFLGQFPRPRAQLPTQLPQFPFQYHHQQEVALAQAEAPAQAIAHPDHAARVMAQWNALDQDQRQAVNFVLTTFAPDQVPNLYRAARQHQAQFAEPEQNVFLQLICYLRSLSRPDLLGRRPHPGGDPSEPANKRGNF